MKKLPKISNGVHFIGIGGIGVSALAQYYLTKGHEVSGSDLVPSEITEALRKKGAKIIIGKHKIGNVLKNVDLIIYSPAVQKNNPELIERGSTSIMSYPEALGELTKKHFTIAVAGTHGKSTVTAMIGLLLIKAGLDPTVIVGTKLKEFGDSNCKVGNSKYLVIEADEHFGSFLNYWPKIIVLTNIEKDHLDYYKNLRNIRKAFREFINHLPPDGILITKKSIVQKEAKKLKKILKVSGEHNIYNAGLALAVARALQIPDRTSYQALSEYKGSWRRFEIVKRRPIVVSDYGHHPTEIKVTLKAAREKWPQKEIWCVYQPHQYQRTHYLFDDFVKVFRKALRPAQGKPPIDRIIITDVYDVAGREKGGIKRKVNAQKLVQSINRKNIIYLPTGKIINYLKKNLAADQVLIIMGAGDIYQLVNIFGHRGGRGDWVSPRLGKTAKR